MYLFYLGASEVKIKSNQTAQLHECLQRWTIGRYRYSDMVQKVVTVMAMRNQIKAP